MRPQIVEAVAEVRGPIWCRARHRRTWV